jgi:hypothetical protein
MGAEELSQRFFSRDQVRNRMLRRAAEIWGYSESEIDDFDPIVSLLIEACSVEFEKIAGEIGNSQNRMLERLAQLLYPGTVTVHPSHGILQVRSSEPTATLQADSQFIYKSQGNERKSENANIELFFSPSHNTNIVDGAIKYIATARELYRLDDGIQKTPAGSSFRSSVADQHSVWLGLELHEDIRSLDGIGIFFNWINQLDSRDWYPHLSVAEWYLGDHVLQVEQGYGRNTHQRDTRGDLESEFEMMLKIENEVDDYYRLNFIKISSDKNFEQAKTSRQLHPAVFGNFFEKKTLQQFKDPLIWIEIRFQPKVPFDALDNVWCSLNAFPVINRKLNKFSYKLLQNLNIVPLETDGIFLSIKDISNSSGQVSRLIPFANENALQPETYTLRYGANRFDERNSHDTLVNLVELIKEESSFFSSIGEEFLKQNIRELNQIIARLEEKIKNNDRHQSPYPYLIIRPSKSGMNINVEYWSCNGLIANKIPLGTRLQPYRNSNIRDNSLFMIYSTAGGRDKLTDAEKIDHYKKALLTHNRIVTMEDLKIFTLAELGKEAKNVEFKKIFIQGTNPGEGFIRCIEIKIKPENKGTRRNEWEQRQKSLLQKLEKHSANNTPYRIVLDE